ncbi:Phenazine biosynthesis-like domain-containing protein [Hondaea fermentalgiana]|uniref:Phenazine biosynthesis-like domain-containing protein n=1 Tax=Hondaea fermentalgiana TaxID=2315210 RepID=A0A2R5GBD7_9STRA|nr:Phenazine biosynthesis-like domain-containing protein [Hondaea fermentalgiana]|eukprot:GBG28312.1 Phenazine biosynthesis-like domain-containing protein [Hondaea fermentalgiana]
MLRLVRADTLPAEGDGQASFATAVAMEQASYPADEAASPEGMKKRRDEASELFWVALSTDDGAITGFVNGTCTNEDELTDESMSQHVRGGTTLCIHSVVTREDLRRQGLARATLRRYLDHIVASKETSHIRQALLIAKEHLVPFYESCGFRSRGQSSVEHGKDTWFELALQLREIPIACANAFNNPKKAFSGNPAAVCVLPFRTRSLGENEGSSKWTFAPSANSDGAADAAPANMEDSCEVFMKAVAAQMNLSETAFLRDLGPAETEDKAKAHKFELRWKTPGGEVVLCGHATQASAFALWAGETELLPPGFLNDVNTLLFETRSGVLRADRDAEGKVALDFPLETISEDLPASDESRGQVIRALGVDPSQVVFVGRNRMDLLVEVSNRDIVDNLNVDMSLLADIETRGVSVTAKASDNDEFDMVSRFFAPALGVPEDPFTGSAHCYIGPYWSTKLGKDDLRALQNSSRTGVTELTVSRERNRVILRGGTEISWVGKMRSAPFLQS